MLTITLLIIISSFLLIYLTKILNYMVRLNKLMSKFPGPPGKPIIGSGLELATTEDLLPGLIKYNKEYGGVFKLRIGFHYAFMITDYKLTEKIMSSTHSFLNKSNKYKFLEDWLGTGLLTSGDDKWRSHRKTITPAFHFKILENFLEVFDSKGNILLEKLAHNCNKNSFDIYPYMNMCSLDVICESAMGTTVNAQDNSDSEYVQSVKEMCRIQMVKSFNPFKQIRFLYYFTNDYYKEQKAIGVLHKFTLSVIRKRKKELEGGQNYHFGKEEEGRRKLRFLDLLLNAQIDGKPLTEEEVREEVDSFMFAGHDTVSSTTSFALFNISNYPDVQKGIIEELQSIFGNDKKRPPTYSELQEMKYLECVIKETLRLYPPVPLFGRHTREDISFGDAIIPKGTSVNIFAFGIHRSPDFFPDPEKFDPDRFLGSNMQNKLPYSYVPFSAGPRNCIGQKFAMLEMKSTISKILRNFELLPTTPKHKLFLLSETVLKSKNGICMKIKRRNDF